MKKLIQIFVTVAILATSQLAQAGTNKHIKPSDPAPQDSSAVRSKFIVRPLGGEVILTITVLDVNNHPVVGALVSAPCTGQANKYTDSHGVAAFNVGTSCPCSEDAVTVTTVHGCYQQIKVSCGSYTVHCNQ
ncbi:MAG: hypothetical protein JWO03_2639 [Bacteroidetes bacterium]|nr:hypothetical protein [Bacteroidota bacterium]